MVFLFKEKLFNFFYMQLIPSTTLEALTSIQLTNQNFIKMLIALFLFMMFPIGILLSLLRVNSLKPFKSNK